MEDDQNWEVSVRLNKDKCPYMRHNTSAEPICYLPGHRNSICVYENCPKRVPKTCEDCWYLYLWNEKE